MHEYSEEEKVMYCGFVADADADIAVPDRYVRRRVDGNSELPALSKKFCNALQVHDTDKTSKAVVNTLGDRFNALVAAQLFRIDHHLCHLTEL